MRAQRQKRKPETLTMPIPDSLLYPDRYDVSDVEDEKQEEQEEREYTKFELNLGAETPRTGSSLTLDEGYLASQLHGIKEAPVRGKLWHSSSYYDKRRRRDALEHEKESGKIDKDCGICFEVATSPARTLCCGKLFCTEHVTDWLQGPSSDGRCPSCGALNTGIHTLPSSSTIKLYTPPPSLAASRPMSRNEGFELSPSITIQSSSRRSTLSSEEDTSSEEDYSSASSESSNHSWGSLSHKPRSKASSASSLSLPFFDVEADSVLAGKVIGNFLSLVGLTLVLYVLVT
ncbi:hypothetical protein E1B28_003055 [Marasmius oreades]|uniref:RING-type domain-containing protein n=1 Tax=Marasmius oreades TaxID=181124 RepID=A0A9P7RLS9_9AGAR|nr:uncharacterized protein E1B28_003055 [Marasmius oreades]KAG7085493.1 hypothetical protein E1B28_003055 [Marasmius oreades]